MESATGVSRATTVVDQGLRQSCNCADCLAMKLARMLQPRMSMRTLTRPKKRAREYQSIALAAAIGLAFGVGACSDKASGPKKYTALLRDQISKQPKQGVQISIRAPASWSHKLDKHKELNLWPAEIHKMELFSQLSVTVFSCRHIRVVTKSAPNAAKRGCVDLATDIWQARGEKLQKTKLAGGRFWSQADKSFKGSDHTFVKLVVPVDDKVVVTCSAQLSDNQRHLVPEYRKVCETLTATLAPAVPGKSPK